VIDTTGDSQLRSWLVNFTGHETLPYVFVDCRPVGGLEEVMALERSDQLKHLVRGAV
jgi:glutaredoxin-related protein